MKFSKLALVIILHQYFVLFGFGQPPANDNCAGAMLMTVSSDFQGNLIQSTTLDATDSNMGVACSGIGDDDVWFKFEVTNSNQWVYLYPSSGDPILEFYTGTCANLDSLTCHNEASLNEIERVLLIGLTIGDTIYIRVFEGALTPTEMEFFISVYSPPINDICVDAIELIIPVSDDFVSAEISTGNAVDEGISTGTCGIGMASDVWYKFIPTQNYYKVELFLPGFINRSSGNRMTCETVLELRHGSCIGTEIACFGVDCYQGIDYIERNDFVIGDSYYIRIYNSDNSINEYPKSLFIYKLLPEVEDSCLSAEILTVNGNQCGSQSYNNSLGGATETTTPTDACSSGPYLDLWYKFVVTNSTAAIKTTVNSSGNIAIAAFTGTSCSTLTNLQCADINGDGDDELLYLSGLTIGDTIYVRVYDADVANTPINFDICVYTPPVNDFCAHAAEITITNGANCSGSISGNTQGATGTGGCAGGSADDDVWYWFTATAETHAIRINQSSIVEPIIELFDACTGTSLSCSSDGVLFINDAVINDNYYIRVFSSGDGIGQGDFSVCVSTPPSNAQCNLPISLEPLVTCQGLQVFNNIGTPNNVYFNFEANYPGYTIVINSSVENFSPTVSINQNCDIENEIQLFNNSFQLVENEWRFTFGEFVVGQMYNIELNSYNQGEFTICILEPNQHDECANAEVLTNQIEYIRSTHGCTPSSNPSNCESSPNDYWIKFIANTTQTHFVNLQPVLLNQLIFGEILSGNDCNNLSQVACIPQSGFATFSAVSGNTYYIRVWIKKSIPFLGLKNHTGDFIIHISDIEPSNNICANATIINHTSNCSYTPGTTYGATKDNSHSSCSTDTNSADVWYKFTATSPNIRIKVKTLSENFNPVIKLFEATSCSSLSFKVCANNFSNGEDEVLQYNGSNGATYYVLITEGGFSNNAGNFEICITSNTDREFILAKYTQSLGSPSIGSADNYVGGVKAYFVGLGASTQITQLKGQVDPNHQSVSRISANFDPYPNGSISFFNSAQISGNPDFILNGMATVLGPSSSIFYNEFPIFLDIKCNANIGLQTGVKIDSIKIGNITHPVKNVLNGLHTISDFLDYYTVNDGNWSDPTSWSCGMIPPNLPTSNVYIRNNIALDDNHSLGNLTVMSDGKLNIPPNTELTLGLSSLGSNTSNTSKLLSMAGKVNITGGILNVNGGISVGDSLIMTSGEINIDPNNGTPSSYSGHALSINTTKVNLTGGFINILDPSYDSAHNSINISGFSNYPVVYINAVVKLGGGDDANPNNLRGFSIRSKTPNNNQMPPTFGLMHIDSLSVDGGMYSVRRHFSPDLCLYVGSLYISNESEVYITNNHTPIIVTKNFINNGFCMINDDLSPYRSIYFTTTINNSGFVSVGVSSSVERTFSGTGLLSNSIANGYPSGPEGNIVRSIGLNNTIRLQTPLTIFNSIDFHGGKIITSDANLLTLGTNTPSVNIAFCNYLGVQLAGVVGPVKKWYSGNTPVLSKQVIPFYDRECYLNFSNTNLGYVLANYKAETPLCAGLPITNEQGTTIRGVSPTGYWQMSGHDVSGDYSITLNAFFYKRMDGTYIFDNFDKIRPIRKSPSNIWANSGATNTTGPSNMYSVTATGLSGIADFAIGIGDTITKYQSINNGSWSIQDTWNQCSVPPDETSLDMEVSHVVDFSNNFTLLGDLNIKDSGVLNVIGNSILQVGNLSMPKTITLESGGLLNVINGILRVYGLLEQQNDSTIDIKSGSSIEIK